MCGQGRDVSGRRRGGGGVLCWDGGVDVDDGCGVVDVGGGRDEEEASGVVFVEAGLMKFVMRSGTVAGVTLSMQMNAGRRMTVEESWFVGVELPSTEGTEVWWMGMFEADSLSVCEPLC